MRTTYFDTVTDSSRYKLVQMVERVIKNIKEDQTKHYIGTTFTSYPIGMSIKHEHPVVEHCAFIEYEQD
jgi:hypothetical protein